MDANELHDASGTIIQAAFAVHKALGNGFDTDTYKRALAIELNEQNIEFDQDEIVPVLYKARQIGQQQIDFRFGENLILVIKSSAGLSEQDLSWLQRLVDVTGTQSGLVINFGCNSVQVRRATASAA